MEPFVTIPGLTFAEDRPTKVKVVYFSFLIKVPFRLCCAHRPWASSLPCRRTSTRLDSAQALATRGWILRVRLVRLLTTALIATYRIYGVWGSLGAGRPEIVPSSPGPPGGSATLIFNIAVWDQSGAPPGVQKMTSKMAHR